MYLENIVFFVIHTSFLKERYLFQLIKGHGLNNMEWHTWKTYMALKMHYFYNTL